MGKKTPKEIVESKFPDMEIVESAEEAAPDEVRTTKPGASIADLRRKYLGEAAADAGGEEAAEESAEQQNVEVRQVRSKRAPADPADDPGPRSLIINTDDDEVIGSQG